MTEVVRYLGRSWYTRPVGGRNVPYCFYRYEVHGIQYQIASVPAWSARYGRLVQSRRDWEVRPVDSDPSDMPVGECSFRTRAEAIAMAIAHAEGQSFG